MPYDGRSFKPGVGVLKVPVHPNAETALTVFLRSSRNIIEKPTLREKLTAIAGAIVEAGLFRRVSVQLYQDQYGEKFFGWAGLTEEEQEWLATHDTLGPNEYDRARQFGVNLGDIYFVHHDQLSKIVDNPDAHLLSSQAEWKGPGYWHPDDMLFAPLRDSHGKPLGNVTADEPFDGQIPTVEIAALISPFLAIASLLVEQELERRRDPLTTCFNGPFFRHEIRHLADSRELEGLLFLDMDNLKATNDEKGHSAGDRLIQKTAQSLEHLVKEIFGAKSRVFRLHGDEFVITVRAGSLPVPILVEQFKAERDRMVPNISVGAATYDPGEPLWELMARAENEMYREKRHRKQHLRQ